MDVALLQVFREFHMPRIARRAIRLLLTILKDQEGGEVLEYALVAGMIVVSAIATISCVGTKLLGRWNSINASI
jgi:Flp pilus assembly pilin Flp